MKVTSRKPSRRSNLIAPCRSYCGNCKKCNHCREALNEGSPFRVMFPSK
jgi:hypothetical protein